jgi:large subunit ribosomal protein L23
MNMGIFSKKTNKVVEVKEEQKVSTKKSVTTQKNGSVAKKETTPVAVFGNTVIRTHVTEKSMRGEGAGVYTFVVRAESTKVDIKKAIKEKYGVMPKRVRIIWTEGKRAGSSRRGGRRSDWKKAIVTLPKGESISIHHGV